LYATKVGKEFVPALICRGRPCFAAITQAIALWGKLEKGRGMVMTNKRRRMTMNERLGKKRMTKRSHYGNTRTEKHKINQTQDSQPMKKLS
jgi:hypothetical protein